jgi:hypothetical protein
MPVSGTGTGEADVVDEFMGVRAVDGALYAAMRGSEYSMRANTVLMVRGFSPGQSKTLAVVMTVHRSNATRAPTFVREKVVSIYVCAAGCRRAQQRNQRQQTMHDWYQHRPFRRCDIKPSGVSNP